MSSQGVVSSKEASSNPGLCLCNWTRAQNQFSSLYLGTDKTRSTLPCAGCLSSVLSFSFSLSTLVHPCHYHSTSAPYLYLIHLSLMMYNYSNWQQHCITHFEEIIYFMFVLCLSLKNQGIFDEKLAPQFVSKCILLFVMQFCIRNFHQKLSGFVLHHFGPITYLLYTKLNYISHKSLSYKENWNCIMHLKRVILYI
jgi:hypothetical protein